MVEFFKKNILKEIKEFLPHFFYCYYSYYFFYLLKNMFFNKNASNKKYNEVRIKQNV